MVIEKTTDEVILRMPADFDTLGLQRIVNYFRYKEILKSSQASENQIKELVKISKSRWWEENKQKFIK